MITPLVAFTLLMVGCSGSNEAGNPTPEESQLPCPTEPPAVVSAEQAASCVYQGWIDTDPGVVAAYGDESVTSSLPTVFDDPGMRFDGCGPADSSSAITCTWRGTHSEGDFAVHFVASGNEEEGFRVTRAEIG